VIGPPNHTPARAGTARPARAHQLLDELDVAVLVPAGAPWHPAALHAAVATDLGADWCGGAIVVAAGAPAPRARAAYEALAGHHLLARRTVLRLPRHHGIAAAANLALDEATGEYVALLHGSTRPAPGTLSVLTEVLDDDPAALWVTPTAPGLAVVRRAAVLALGGFDPALRGGEAVADLVARGERDAWRVLVIPEAAVEIAARPPARRPPAAVRRRLPRAARRPWSAAALEAWLPRARRAAVRVDLP
jgi:hypothetical protein